MMTANSVLYKQPLQFFGAKDAASDRQLLALVDSVVYPISGHHVNQVEVVEASSALYLKANDDEGRLLTVKVVFKHSREDEQMQRYWWHEGAARRNYCIYMLTGAVPAFLCKGYHTFILEDRIYRFRVGDGGEKHQIQMEPVEDNGYISSLL